MLSLAEARVIADFKRGVTAMVGDRLLGMTLFGSRARGEGTETSDLDVLVRVRHLSRDERRAMLDLACDLEQLQTGLAVSPLVIDPGKRRLAPALESEIAEDGVAL